VFIAHRFASQNAATQRRLKKETKNSCSDGKFVDISLETVY
jgi:hypothetical protein